MNWKMALRKQEFHIWSLIVQSQSILQWNKRVCLWKQEIKTADMCSAGAILVQFGFSQQSLNYLSKRLFWYFRKDAGNAINKSFIFDLCMFIHVGNKSDCNKTNTFVYETRNKYVRNVHSLCNTISILVQSTIVWFFVATCTSYKMLACVVR